jgi:hypothetical protein
LKLRQISAFLYNPRIEQSRLTKTQKPIGMSEMGPMKITSIAVIAGVVFGIAVSGLLQLRQPTIIGATQIAAPRQQLAGIGLLETPTLPSYRETFPHAQVQHLALNIAKLPELTQL